MTTDITPWKFTLTLKQAHPNASVTVEPNTPNHLAYNLNQKSEVIFNDYNLRSR